MKSESQFDLNLAVQHWRADLAQSPALRAENLDELETHLRDSITELQRNRLSSEEAFLIATRRAGKTEALSCEFHKVNSSALLLDRALWMLAGFLLTMVSFDLARIAQTSLLIITDILSHFSRSQTAQVATQMVRSWTTTTMLFPILFVAFTILAITAILHFERSKTQVPARWSNLLKRPALVAFSVIACGLILHTANISWAAWHFTSVMLTTAAGVAQYPIFITILLQMPVYLWGALLVLVVVRKRLEATTR